MTQQFLAKQIKPAPSMSFAVVWLCFAIFLAYFWRGAIEDAEIVVQAGLVAFHAAFVGAGVIMLYSALRWRRFVQAFGTPTLTEISGGNSRQPLEVSVRFDRAWADGERLVASVTWVSQDFDGDIVETFESGVLTHSRRIIGNATQMDATGAVPVASTETLAARAVPELRLHLEGRNNYGWRLRIES